jgi:elongation factor P
VGRSSEFQHHKPGKGNTALVRSKLKHVLSGKVVDKTFNSDVKVESAHVDRREMQYLYKDGDAFVFMDTTSYEQVNIPAETVSGMPPTTCWRTRTRWWSPRRQPALRRTPGLGRAGDHLHRARPAGRSQLGGTKPATLETGKQIQVPLFIEAGTKVKVDTRDGSYLGRVND